MKSVRIVVLLLSFVAGLSITLAQDKKTYILKYVEHIDNPNRFISVQEGIGDIQIPTKGKIETIKDLDVGISVNDSMALLRKSCESLLKLPEEKHIRKKYRGIALTLKNLKYHGDHVHLQFEIKNNSEIRFDFDTLSIYKVNGNLKRNASYQEIPLKHVYVHQKPTQIFPNKTVKMVYVFPKFVKDGNERMEVRLKELNTTRNVNLIWR